MKIKLIPISPHADRYTANISTESTGIIAEITDLGMIRIPTEHGVYEIYMTGEGIELELDGVKIYSPGEERERRKGWL